MSDKTATERLRELLDERGVEWRRTPHYSYESTDTETVFPGEGIEWIAGDHLNGRVGLHALRYEVTPEQAIAATLGSVTCHDASIGRYREYGTLFTCSECGATVVLLDDQNEPTILSDGVGMHPRYCPNCGRKVASDEN